MRSLPRSLPAVPRWTLRALLSYSFAAAAALIVASFFLPLTGFTRGRPSTVAFAELVVIVLVATSCGAGPALVAAVLSAVLWTYWFLLPSEAHFSVADTVILSLFLLTSLILIELAARMRDRAAEQRKFKGVLEAAPDPMLVMDKRGAISLVNPQLERLLGHTRQELCGVRLETLFAQPASAERVADPAALAAASPVRTTSAGQPLIAVRKDGTGMPVEVSLKPVQVDGAVIRVGTIRDLTQEKRAEQLREGQSRILEMIAKSSPLEEVLTALAHLVEAQAPGVQVMIVLLCGDGVHVRLGAAPGFAAEYLQALQGFEIGPAACSCGTAMWRGEQVIVTDTQTDPLWANYRHLAARHGLRACWSTPIFSQQGKVLGSFAMYYRDVRRPGPAEIALIALATNIAGIAIERSQGEERIAHLAHYDPLTDLPNRALFQDRASQAIAQAKRDQTPVAILLIDLDQFKDINDSLGHPIGDQLLREAGGRLQRCLRDGDTVARLGGDEFAICLRAAHGAPDAIAVANKVLSELRRPFLIEGHELHTSSSVGVALYPADGTEPDTLVRNADAALYHAKERGRDTFEFFRLALNEAVQQRLSTAKRLRSGLRQREFLLHYQPQIDLQSGRITVAEALLRWRQPDGRLISGGEFVRVAEDSGLIVPLGEWVLRESCRQLHQWRAAGHRHLRVAVNVSPRQFRSPGFAGFIAETLRECSIPAACLELEITEGLLLPNNPESVTAIEGIAALGARLVVDDFGTGYSSLTYLRRFPVHALKIDRSFISGIPHDSNALEIVTAIIAMAKSLHLDVIAEGVETVEQIDFLRRHGCPAAQGFYYSPAVGAEDLDRLIRERTGKTAAGR